MVYRWLAQQEAPRARSWGTGQRSQACLVSAIGLRQLPSCPEHQLPGCKLGKEGPIPVSHLLPLSGSLGLVPHPHCPLGPSRKSS